MGGFQWGLSHARAYVYYVYIFQVCRRVVVRLLVAGADVYDDFGEIAMMTKSLISRNLEF